MIKKKALIIGTGLGGLATAMRLSHQGYEVEMIEKYHQAGGRLNTFYQDGFTFDTGPSFFSMGYEFTELFDYCEIPNPLELVPLNPLYSVYFEDNKIPYNIYKDLDKLAEEFKTIEPNFRKSVEKFLKEAGDLFHDTENKVIRRNFDGKLNYLASLSTVPLKHAPKLFRTFWKELERHFESDPVKIIFSLVAFFLGATPFNTPAVYTLLNYTELKHDGYWNVKGGMYTIVQKILEILHSKKVKITYNTEIVKVLSETGEIRGFKDQYGLVHKADIYVCNADAASFRGQILKRKNFSEQKLYEMHWTLAPFTIYLGVKGKIEGLNHHNYFLGKNFKDYADNIFTASNTPDKPYYYVNVSSKSNPNCAPEGCENLFILCPVPDLRYKNDWSDAESLAKNIIADLSKRVGFDISSNILTQTILTPKDWESKFNLYKGSGLGLAHGLNQIGGFRPSNKDEEFKNLYYTGASTVPGTGLPIVIISSKLVTERILKDHKI